MKLLYLAYRFPYPPDKGERIRAFHQIRVLSERFEVHLVCPRPRRVSKEASDELGRYCAAVHLVRVPTATGWLRQLGHWVAGRPRALGVHCSRGLARTVSRVFEANSIDVVFASTIFASGALREIRDTPVVVDFMDVYSDIVGMTAELPGRPFRRLERLEARRLANYEVALAEDVDHAIFVSNAEARLFGQKGSLARVSALGNGVDLGYFGLREGEPQAADGCNIVFVGTMDYPPNIEAVRYFAREVLPEFLDDYPRLRFLIVGRNPTRWVRSLSRNPAIEVTGEVPDIRPYLERATLAVAPFRIARGVQNKVLEALAMGVPIVASPQALQGLDLEDPDLIPQASNAREFKEEVRRLLDDPDHRRSCAVRGRQYVERAHRWADKGRELSQLLTGLVEDHRRSQAADA